MDDLKIFCVDVGSIAGGKFAWSDGLPENSDSSSPCRLVDSVVGILNSGRKVALGFECPLFIPVRDDVKAICRARRGEGNRPWSAGTGSAVLATGVAQTTWILARGGGLKA